jgi:aspartate aminotransferase
MGNQYKIANPYKDLKAGEAAIRGLVEKLYKQCSESGLEPLELIHGNPVGPTDFRYAFHTARLAILESLGLSQSNGYEASSRGYPGYLLAMSELEKKVNGIPIPPEHILAVPGAGEGVATLLWGFKEAGITGEVILLAPYFPPFESYITSAGLTPKLVGFLGKDILSSPDGEDLYLSRIEESINQNTMAIIINSPNNPTGHIYSKRFLNKLGEILNKHGNILAISDEPYRELILPGNEWISVISNLNYSNTAVVYSHSKGGRLAGCRDAYAALHPDFPDAPEVAQALANTLPKRGVIQAHTREQMVLSKCKFPFRINWEKTMNLVLMYNTELQRMGYEIIEPKGAFYISVRSPDGDGMNLFKKLMENGVGAVPGEGFGIPEYVRLALCTKDARKINKVLPRFQQVLKEF